MHIDSSIIEFFVKIVDGMMDIIQLALWGEQKAAESSRIGDSPMERENRRWWQRVFNGWFWIVLGLGLLLAILRWW